MKALGKGSIASLVQAGLLVAWWVLRVALIGWAIAALAYVLCLILAGAGVIEPAAIPILIDNGFGGSVRVSISGVNEGVFSDLALTDWQIIAPALLAGVVILGGSLIIVGRLRKLFDSFTSGEPFRRENAQHLRVIWITMVVMELSRYAMLALIATLLTVFGKPDFVRSVSFSIDSENLSSWLSILVLVVLAEVFREGARMKEEQELTI